MRVELLVTLRGIGDDRKRAKWSKGTIFDDNNGKNIPKSILTEVAMGNKTVRLLHDAAGKPIGDVDAGEAEKLVAELQAACKIIESQREDLSNLKKEISALKEPNLKLQDETRPHDTSGMEDPTNATGVMFKCPVPGCESGKLFSSENGLKMHITRVHPDVASNYYQD